MKYLKIIGLAALADMALATLAASSASAAKICSTAGTGTACGTGHGAVYNGPLVGKNSGNVVFKWTNTKGEVTNTVTATGSEIAGEVTSGETGVGKITKMVVSGVSSTLCSSVTLATSASTANPWPFAVATELATENTNGIISWEGTTWTYSCTYLGLPVTCKYRAAKLEGKLDGSDTAPKLTISQATLEKEEGNETVCGAKEDFTATYNITTPTSLFIE